MKPHANRHAHRPLPTHHVTRRWRWWRRWWWWWCEMEEKPRPHSQPVAAHEWQRQTERLIGYRVVTVRIEEDGWDSNPALECFLISPPMPLCPQCRKRCTKTADGCCARFCNALFLHLVAALHCSVQVHMLVLDVVFSPDFLGPVTHRGPSSCKWRHGSLQRHHNVFSM